MVDITEVVVAVIALIGTIITTVVVPLLKQKLGVEKFNTAKDLARIAVMAAEKIYVGPGRGEEKKEYVEAMLTEQLAKYNIKMDMEEINALIEAMVLNIDKDVPAAK